MTVSLKAPVGEKNRITKGKPVKNAPADVELVQLMLVANGINVSVSGKCNSTLVKAIKAFQKSRLGYKKPDGIVDPGDKTWKAGFAKLDAKIKADLKFAENVVIITVNGKTKQVSKAEFERHENELKKKILDKANMMYGQAESWLEFCEDAEATAQGADGFMMSFTSFLVSAASGGKSDPPYGPLTDARSGASLLRALVDRSKPDWKKVIKQDAKATKAYNKGVKAFDKFIKARIETASSIAGKLEIVREVSFAVVEAYVTAELMTKKGMSPAKAHGIAAAGTEAMKSSAGQLGEYLAGNKVTWESAGKKVFVDTVFAGAAGMAGGKITGAFSNQVTRRLSLYLAPKVSSAFSKKALNIFLNKIMTTKAMQELVTSAAKETIGLFKPMVEKGRAPTEKEVNEAIIKTITGGVLGISPVKTLQSFDKALPAKTSEYLSKTLVPTVAEKVRADLIKKHGKEIFKKLPKAFQDDLIGDVVGGFKGKAIELYVLSAADGSNGDTKESQLHKLGQNGLRKDTKLRKEIEAMIFSKMAQELKSLEKAK